VRRGQSLMSFSVPVVEFDHVGYSQQGVDILQDIDWRLNPAEHWTVLGPNGSGKTTLLRLAGGYLWPTSGTVRRLGEELLDLRELRRAIGWASPEITAAVPPAERTLDSVVSGKFAQVGLKPVAGDAPTEADFAHAWRLLERLECAALADKPFGVLSQGERQQVLVARAQMVDPLAIILDEPCAGMDPGVRERFLHWLAGRAADGASPAIVFVTHHVEEIMPGFECTLVLHKGRIVAAGPTQDVVTPTLLKQVYGLNVSRIERHSGRLWPIWE
jgi:iron complex transport system ATP-binding protein